MVEFDRQMSSEDLEGILDATPVGILVVDTAGKVVTSNLRFSEMWKIPSELLESKDDRALLEFVLEQLVDCGQFLARVEELYGSTERSVDKLFFKDGRVFERSSRPLLKDGQLTGRVWVFNDTTADHRRQVLEAQRARAERDRLVTIMETTTDLVSWSDVDGRLQYLNRAGFLMLGWEEDLSDRRIKDVHPKWAAEFIKDEAIPAAVRDGVWRGETAIVNSEGVEVPTSQVIMAHKNEDGETDYFSTIIRDISETKEAENRAREAQDLLHAAVENAQAGVLVADAPDVKIRIANRAALGIRGASNEPLTDIPAVLHPSHWQVFRPDGTQYQPEELPLSRAVLKGEHVQGEVAVIRRSDGEDRWVLANASPTLDDSGKVVAGIVFFLDVTERMLAEKRTKESEAQFRLLAENTTDMIWTMDPDGTLKYVSPSVEKMLGYTAEQYLAMEKGSRVTPSSWKRVLENLLAAREALVEGSEDPETYVARDEYEYYKKDGSTVWAESVASWALDENGEVAGLQGVTRDISERKVVEEELESLRGLLSSIVNSMPSVLIGVDSEGVVTQWNRQAEQLTGVSAKDACGNSLPKVSPLFSAEMKRVKDVVHHNMSLGETQIPYELDGVQRFMDITVYPLGSEMPRGAVIRVDDVTERVRLNEAIVQSEKMLSVGGLAAGMAHEINNPLAAILQGAQVITMKLEGDSERNRKAAQLSGASLESIHEYVKRSGASEMLRGLSESGVRASHIVKNMLSFARKSEASFENHDLAVLMDRAVELASNDYDLKKKFDFRLITIERDYNPEAPPVKCESNEILQVLLNLLRNGAQAMHRSRSKEGGSRLRLAVRPEVGWVVLEVEDNGPGMADDVRKRVFEPFFTTKSVGLGTGLGLSVSYFIITENHGGEMEVRSTPGKGTCFTICLPAGNP